MVKILLVDDDPNILKSFHTFLTSNGYYILCCTSAEEGLEAFEKEPFDVILSDVRMPGMDGIDFLQKVRSADPKIGFIVFTAFPSVSAAVNSLKALADDYLEKPVVNFDNLMVLVDQLFEKVQKRRNQPDEDCLLTGKPGNFEKIENLWENINPENFSSFIQSGKATVKNEFSMLNEFVREKITQWPDFNFLSFVEKNEQYSIVGSSWFSDEIQGIPCRRDFDSKLFQEQKRQGGKLFVMDAMEEQKKHPDNKRKTGRMIILPFGVSGQVGSLLFQCPQKASVDMKVLTFLTEIIAFTQWLPMAQKMDVENTSEPTKVTNKDFQKDVGHSAGFNEFIGKAPCMQEIYNSIIKIAPTDVTVLITGETGTGKELAAQTIHDLSHRKDDPFVAINCATISETLLESELFGHEKGAFTGADRMKTGLFESANGGTIFFDEVGEISPAMQVKLLRVLQEKEIRRVGNNRPIKIDVRVIASTNRNLANDVYLKKFREDLFYRLNVINIHLPPLRERGDDIRNLINHFLKNYEEKYKMDKLFFANSAMQMALRYPWPGNVRELMSLVEKTVILSEENRIVSLPISIPLNDAKYKAHLALKSTKLKDAKRYWAQQFEREFIAEKIKKHRGNIAATAKEIGVDVKTVWRKVRRLGINV